MPISSGPHPGQRKILIVNPDWDSGNGVYDDVLVLDKVDVLPLDNLRPSPIYQCSDATISNSSDAAISQPVTLTLSWPGGSKVIVSSDNSGQVELRPVDLPAETTNVNYLFEAEGYMPLTGRGET